MPGASFPSWYCGEHIPEGAPPPTPRRQPHRQTAAAEMFRQWPRRKMPVYVDPGLVGHRLVFAFGLEQMAAAAGCSPETVRREIHAKKFDPSSLTDIVRWAGERAAQPQPAELPPLADAFSVASKPAQHRRDRVVAELRERGFAVVEPDADPRRINIFGDRFCVATAERVLEHMRAQDRRTLSQAEVRRIVMGRIVQKVEPPSPTGDNKGAKLVGELRGLLGIEHVRMISTKVVEIAGLRFAREKAAELAMFLRKPTKRSRAIRAALAALIDYRQAGILARTKRLRAKLKRTRIPTAADSP